MTDPIEDTAPISPPSKTALGPFTGPAYASPLTGGTQEPESPAGPAPGKPRGTGSRQPNAIVAPALRAAARSAAPDPTRTARTGKKPRLIVVSNRVPVPSRNGTAAGGLAVALNAALKQAGGVWFGWSGETNDSADQNRPIKITEAGNVTFAVMDLTQDEHDRYYAGFANRALWPICHYRLDLLQIDGAETEGYLQVNRLFAQRLIELVRPGDVIWVHDYHLIPLATHLREAGLTNRIGFFLHIPWPPPDVASALPAYETLLRGFAAYDVVGFQTPGDAENFGRCLAREGLGRAVDHNRYRALDHTITARAFPISIDVEGFRKTAREAERNALVRRLAESMGGRSLIIGVDRLDYSKGIKQRIEAFSCFIRNNPQARNKVTYLQITPKSRSDVPEYRKMQHEVAEQAGWTNGNFGDVDWVPIRYVNKSIAHSSLAGLYRYAHVGLVTPLRDGMNLVAKEFVAAQREDDPGVLILSRFAGAAAELDAALLVNPYDSVSVANAIARALAMPMEERQERWRAMMSRLRDYDIDAWCADFLSALAGCRTDDRESPEIAAGPAAPAAL